MPRVRVGVRAPYGRTHRTAREERAVVRGPSRPRHRAPRHHGMGRRTHGRTESPGRADEANGLDRAGVLNSTPGRRALGLRGPAHGDRPPGRPWPTRPYCPPGPAPVLRKALDSTVALRSRTTGLAPDNEVVRTSCTAAVGPGPQRHMAPPSVGSGAHSRWPGRYRRTPRCRRRAHGVAPRVRTTSPRRPALQHGGKTRMPKPPPGLPRSGVPGGGVGRTGACRRGGSPRGQRRISLIFSMRVMTRSSSSSSKTFFQSSRTIDSRP